MRDSRYVVHMITILAMEHGCKYEEMRNAYLEAGRDFDRLRVTLAAKDAPEPPTESVAGSAQEHCMWREDADYEGIIWLTGCDNSICLTDGTPAENQWRYCPYCGREIEEQPPTERESE